MTLDKQKMSRLKDLRIRSNTVPHKADTQLTHPKRDHNPLVNYTSYRMRIATEAISELAALIYAKDLGISIVESRIINLIGSLGPMSTYQIAHYSHLDRVKVSRASQRLTAANFLKRRVNQKDRRLITLSLTAKGKKTFENILFLMADFENEILDVIGKDELDRLNKNFIKLEKHFSQLYDTEKSSSHTSD